MLASNRLLAYLLVQSHKCHVTLEWLGTEMVGFEPTAYDSAVELVLRKQLPKAQGVLEQSLN
jgi:hypothetical protein